jgi:arylsulfatase A-like enzyme
VDEGVENILNTLSRNGQLENTIVIFTSDQGQLLGEHRIAEGLGWVYDESIQVPLFIRGPGFPAGQLNGSITMNIDLTATLLEVAQATPTRTLDGRSLMPLMRDPAAPWRTTAYIFSQLANRVYKAVRTSEYLFAESSFGEDFELYDLKQDPHQLTSRHNDPAYQQIRQALQQVLNQLKVCAGATCWK